MLLCPNCRRKVEGGEYANFRGQWWGARTSQIRCPGCGYYGLPIEMRRAPGKSPGRQNTQKDDWAEKFVFSLFILLMLVIVYLIVNGFLHR